MSSYRSQRNTRKRKEREKREGNKGKKCRVRMRKRQKTEEGYIYGEAMSCSKYLISNFMQCILKAIFGLLFDQGFEMQGICRQRIKVVCNFLLTQDLLAALQSRKHPLAEISNIPLNHSNLTLSTQLCIVLASLCRTQHFLKQ